MKVSTDVRVRARDRALGISGVKFCPDIRLFPLSSCQYVSTIPEKKLHVTDLSRMDIL